MPTTTHNLTHSAAFGGLVCRTCGHVWTSHTPRPPESTPCTSPKAAR